jgi:hypothetical protein
MTRDWRCDVMSKYRNYTQRNNIAEQLQVTMAAATSGLFFPWRSILIWSERSKSALPLATSASCSKASGDDNVRQSATRRTMIETANKISAQVHRYQNIKHQQKHSHNLHQQQPQKSHQKSQPQQQHGKQHHSNDYDYLLACQELQRIRSFLNRISVRKSQDIAREEQPGRLQLGGKR